MARTRCTTPCDLWHGEFESQVSTSITHSSHSLYDLQAFQHDCAQKSYALFSRRAVHQWRVVLCCVSPSRSARRTTRRTKPDITYLLAMHLTSATVCTGTTRVCTLGCAPLLFGSVPDYSVRTDRCACHRAARIRTKSPQRVVVVVVVAHIDAMAAR